MHTVIAIDGPSGVGKGTVARAIAAALGYRHVDTGAMYRAVAWRAGQLGVDLDDEEAVERVARAAVIEVDGSRVVIDGTDVSSAIRTPDVDRATTRVARLPRVRAELVARQRALAEEGPLLEGDIDVCFRRNYHLAKRARATTAQRRATQICLIPTMQPDRTIARPLRR